MKKLLLILFVCIPVLGSEFRLDNIQSLNIEDKTGTGLFEITFKSGEVAYGLDTLLTQPFILEQCLQSIRTAMASELSIVLTGSGSPSNLRLYACQLRP